MTTRRDTAAITSIPWKRQPNSKRIHAAVDYDTDTLFALATALQKTGRTSEAESYFARLRKIAPRYPGLPALTDSTVDATR